MAIISRMSLTAKLAAIIVSINLFGLIAFATYTWQDQTHSALNTASGIWKNSSEQFADLVSGGVKWGKAEAVQEAYAIYRDDPSLQLLQFAAFNAEGELVDQWSAPGADFVPAATPLSPSENADEEKTIVDKGQASNGYVQIASPIVRDKKGRATGSVVTAWATDSIYQQALTKIGGLVASQLLMISLCVVAFLFAMRSLVGRPLNAISERINGLQSGDYQSPVQFQERGDEIGIVARALEHFRNESIEKAEQERIAAEDRNTLEEERAQNSRLVESNAQSQKTAVDKLASAMETLADGDFTTRLDDLGAGFEKITHDFNAMVSSVSDTLGEVTAASDQVDAGSEALASSADQLAKRAEHQAASLQETAAAVAEITETVKTSSTEASDTVLLVTDTKKSAHSSAVLVRDAIDAMGKIQGSSGKIGQIIGVIDEIAFQTNLLALNAGVEAARAGDAGNGFAVVAQEVRELAQRSATAAKEIKELVTASGDQVTNGVALVNSTGDSLLKIEEQISSIDAAIKSIVESYGEQSAGLQEINGNITQMDRSTQHNAAMAEETNAASQDLMSQGQILKSAVSRFVLPPIKPTASVSAPAVEPASNVQPIRMPSPGISEIHIGPAAAAAWEEF